MIARPIRRIVITLLIALAPVFSAPRAEVRGVTVTVEGLSCLFCAFGVEKKLRGVACAGFVEIDLRQGTATLPVADGRSMAVENLPDALEWPGWATSAIRILATGTLRPGGQAVLASPSPNPSPNPLTTNAATRYADRVTQDLLVSWRSVGYEASLAFYRIELENNAL